MSQTTSTTVPFLDLSTVNAPVKDRLVDEIAQLIDTGQFINGPAVAEFERTFAEYTGVTHCVGVASGLDALRLALLALDIEPGDEVVVPAQTFVATLEAVTQAGGRPVVADISESDYCLDPEAFRSAIGPKTRFVMPVDLYGQLADLKAIKAIADEHGIVVLEDACQAHGAERDGYAPGAFGPAAFSFYPAKNLGAFGDAGALITDDASLADRLRALREHGQVAKYEHEYEGYTARLDSLQALVLQAKLSHLDDASDQRRRVADAYNAELAGVGDLTLPPVASDSNPVWHLYVIRTADHAALAAHLRERGVGTARHYPIPPHLSPAYAHLGHAEGAFPVAEQLARECLSLPMFPGMADDQIAWAVASVKAFFPA